MHIDGSETIAEEAVDALDAVHPPSTEPILLLQKMENRLVRHHLAAPDVLSGEELRKLRYILSFARLADFEPGACRRTTAALRVSASEVPPSTARGASDAVDPPPPDRHRRSGGVPHVAGGRVHRLAGGETYRRRRRRSDARTQCG
jgi:hypothetical protein